MNAIGVPSGARLTAGRHRAGVPGLHHCRDLEAVQERLARYARIRRQRGLARLRTVGRIAAIAAIAAAIAAVAVSGWLTFHGASAILGMLAP